MIAECRVLATARAICGLTVLLTGCSSLDGSIRRDADEVGTTVERRVGVESPSGETLSREPGSTSPEVQALLVGELTEESAVKIALLNNPRVRESFERLGIARADLLQAGLFTNPVFDVSAKFFRSGTEIELGIAQSFLDLFFIPLRKRIAAAELDVAKARTTRELVALVFEVRRAFVNVRAAQQMVELRQHVLEAAKASQELMLRLHEAGNVTDPMLTSEDIALARARLDLAVTEAEMVEAREPLSVLLGLWGRAIQWQITGSLPEETASEPSLARIESRSVAASLDLAENRAHIAAAAEQVGLTSWESLVPTGQAGVVAKKETDEAEFGVGPALAVTIPLFDQGGARRGIARARLREALSRHLAIAVEVRSAARLLRDRSLALHERAKFYRTVHLPLFARLLRETLQNYNAMQIGVFDVLVVRQQQIDAARGYLETLRDLWLARLDLDELIAGSLNENRLSTFQDPAHEANALPRKGH